MADSVRLEITIEGDNPTWVLRYSISDGSGGASASLDWEAALWTSNEETIDAWITRVYASTRGNNSSSKVGLREMSRQLGKALYEQIFTEDMKRHLKRLRERLQEGVIQEIQIYLDLRSDTLANIPWEILFEPTEIGFLAIFPGIALVRYVNVGSSFAALAFEGRPRVLALTAQPKEYSIQGYNSRDYVQIFQSLKKRGVIDFDMVSGKKTIEKAKARLIQPTQILDILSHGGFTEDDSEFKFVFADSKGELQRLPLNTLRSYLFEWKVFSSLKLVFIRSCFSGPGNTAGLIGNAGMALAVLNVPAVISMQFRIPVVEALQIGSIFYEKLADHGFVTQALREARQFIYQHHEASVNWAISVLTLRCADTRLITKTDIPALNKDNFRTNHAEDLLGTRVAELRLRLDKSSNQTEIRSLRFEINHVERKQAMRIKLISKKRKRKDLAQELSIWVSELINDMRNEVKEGRGYDKLFYELRDDALYFIDQALEIEKTARYHLIRAEIESEINGDFADALVHCREAMRSAPEFDEPCYRVVQYAVRIEQDPATSGERKEQLRREIAEALRRLQQMGRRIEERLANEYLDSD